MSSVNILLLVNKHKTSQDHIGSSTQVYVACLSLQYHLNVSIYIIMLKHNRTCAYGLHKLMLHKFIKLAENYYLQKVGLEIHLFMGQVNCCMDK